MAEITGPFSLAVRHKLCGAFRSQMQTTERLLAKVGTILRTTDGGAHWMHSNKWNGAELARSFIRGL